MLRLIAAFLLTLLPSTHAAAAQTANRDYSDMPVIVLYCDEDPGRIQAGGGKEPSPDVLVESGRCTPAEGVALTFLVVDNDWDFETDDPAEEIDWDVEDDGWFARCDTDADGYCALNSPVGFDIVIGVVLHESTVTPGYVPAFFQSATHNYTEFAGYGLALIPEDDASPEAEPAEHQTLALNITRNNESGSVLTEWEINDKDNDVYLATNADGWVSNIVAANDTLEIDLVNIPDHADVSAVCGANDDTTVEVEAQTVADTVKIQVPDTESDIRCDVTVTE